MADATHNQPFFDIDYYHRMISPTLARQLISTGRPFVGIEGLVEVGVGGGLETVDAMKFLLRIFDEIKTDLKQVLDRRDSDRRFLDARVRACYEFNKNLSRDISSEDYKTVIGLEDSNGRIVFGPNTKNYCKSGGTPIAEIPEYLKGPHVTLFGPPDSAKMAINAMNAYHRKIQNEPAIVSKLLAELDAAPKWGADDEDSKTPLRADLVDAAVNLTGCFDKSLKLEEKEKKYELAKDHLSLPIKRFPGLALPSTFLFYKNNPIPLHLYDFALHFYANCKNPESLVFYVPKLETEEEARYIHKMIAVAENMITEKHPNYRKGTVRLMIVLENPRAILRTHEIMDALHPYFVGASLGWHDYLASTARIFKEDGNYRIPVKADPDIVIKYIQASHRMLADVVGSRGGIKVGGMYGILPLNNEVDSPSFQMTIKGFIKDVVTQLKRDLTGFWVAHPDFVRIGLALVAAWKKHQAGDKKPLIELVGSLLNDNYRMEVLKFIEGPDIIGLDPNDENYVRSLIVADIKESDFIPNNDPEEIRYNVFQSLQYLTDWLCGNGCVALPAIVNGIPVRVMDDLATAERSRWEVWHEIRHGRFKVEDFLRIAFEEMHFIRKDLSDDKKIVQVKYNDITAKWYPVAFRIMLQLMTDPNPPEFATELLMPFTTPTIRDSKEPLLKLFSLDAGILKLSENVEKFVRYFEACGCLAFATEMAQLPIFDADAVSKRILKMTLPEILEAASFHGDIGEMKKTLDKVAAAEQSQVLQSEDSTRQTLLKLGQDYLQKYGFKFLISAQNKSALDILDALKTRLLNSKEKEIENARLALLEITLKRFANHPLDLISLNVELLRQKHEIRGLSVSVNNNGHTQSLCFGEANAAGAPVTSATSFQIASLSKTLASAYILELLREKNIATNTSVNVIFKNAKSNFKLQSDVNPAWADQVTIEDLLSHTALNMHYVNGIPSHKKMPNVSDLIAGLKEYDYEPVRVVNEPGTIFKYSGGGFLVLEHLVHTLTGKTTDKALEPFLTKFGLHQTQFSQDGIDQEKCANGFMDNGQPLASGRMKFPAFAAGVTSTAHDVAHFLNALTEAFQNTNATNGLSHDTAVQMLYGQDKGSRAFMGADMGLGVFILEGGENRFAIHQGSNEGFRALFMQCFTGPDKGKGFVILANGDNRAVELNAAVAKEILHHLQTQDIDYARLGRTFDFSSAPQEQKVNLGLKALLFDAFTPDLPEPILNRGPLSPIAEFNLAVNAKIISVSNQKFARAENLFSPYEPVFDPELFGRQGKIMDSWESARHSRLGMENLIFEIKNPARMSHVYFSTRFHNGNHVEYVRLLGRDEKNNWVELLPKTKLTGHAQAVLPLSAVASKKEFQLFDLQTFPDGGLTRMALFEKLPPIKMESTAFQDSIPKATKPLSIPFQTSNEEVRKNLSRISSTDFNFSSAAFGAQVTAATNEHYGPAVQVISPFPPLHMFDGLESARSRVAGHFEEATIRLAKPCHISDVVVDFKFFVNNNPAHLSIDGLSNGKKISLAVKTPVKAFAGNQKKFEVDFKEAVSEITLRTYPDGGINRVYVFGRPANGK